MSSIRHDLLFDYDKYAWILDLGFSLASLEFVFKNPINQEDPDVKEKEAELTGYVKRLLKKGGLLF